METTIENIKQERIKEKAYTSLLDKSLRIFFWHAFRVCVKNPSQALSFFRTMQTQIGSAKTRAEYARKGIQVPPILIFSVTSRCNLRCKGCYNWSLRPEQHEEMSSAKIRQIVAEASELGISFVVMAGGEPFMRPEIMDITAEFPKTQFIIFTNGLLLDEKTVTRLEQQRNVIPVISLEGNERQTDDRRGNGITKLIENVTARLKGKHIFWGTSLTVTSENMATLTESRFIANLNNLGCQLFFFVEYTPVASGSEYLVISDEQRAALGEKVTTFRDEFSALFVSVPGDEAEFGGCLAAGRGFIHISADGNVEPCPFVPYSDASLKNMPLKEALQSDFLRKIRDNSDVLEEGAGGCSLWNKKDWLNSVLSKNG